MKRSIRHRLLASGIVAAAAAATMPLAPAHAEPAGSDVPSTIAVEEGHKVFLVGHAVGVQIYICNPSTNGFAWTLVAPRADLYGDNGKLVATHFGGPRWQARDGSTVRAARRGDPVTVDPTAIPGSCCRPWRRAPATTATNSPTPRSSSEPPPPAAWLLPRQTCNANTMDTTEEVPYTADYHFWKSTGH